MRLSQLTEVRRVVGATTSRRDKVTALAEALADADDGEVGLVARYLSGRTRQDGRLNAGWATVRELATEPATSSTLEITEVDAVLEEVADLSGAGSVAARRAALGDLWARATAAEQELLAGLVLGELRQGALEGLVVQAIAQAAEVPQAPVRRALMLSADLGDVALAARTGGADALAAFTMAVGRFVQPMLAAPAASGAEALEGLGDAVAEVKLDGARVQIHRSGDEVVIWTRTGKDATARAPEVVTAIAALDVDRLVLDGEVLALRDDGRPHRFQDTMRRFGERGDPDAVPGRLALFAFDCLHLDGRDLLDEPLAVRWAAIEDVVPPELRISRRPVTSPGDVQEVIDAAAEAGHEGVVVKDLDAPYAAGRRGKAWRKVKPVITLDLVVLAAEWGSGRRRGTLSNLHLGARDTEGGFVMLGKTFKGLTDEVLAWQTEALLAREVRRDGHIVHVRPELVVEIALDGVQTSRRYPAGMALRFARVRGYREDKRAEDADHVDAVRAIWERTG